MVHLQSACVGLPGEFFGTRSRAFKFRDEIERLLFEEGAEKVTVSFDGVSATQSFVDELLGVLVLQRGPDVVQRLKFRHCSDELKAIIRFVLNDRIEQLESEAQRH